MKTAKGDLHRHLLGSMLQQYFCQHLIDQRDLSPETIRAYRDTFKLLLYYLEKQCRRKVERLCVVDLDAPCIMKFLQFWHR